MCGIAGLIHRGKSSNVGEELQHMLQALKHRGPDSTGYALYADNDGQNFILRFKVGENVGEGSTSVNEDESVYNERKKAVDKKWPLRNILCITYPHVLSFFIANTIYSRSNQIIIFPSCLEHMVKKHSNSTTISGNILIEKLSM